MAVSKKLNRPMESLHQLLNAEIRGLRHALGRAGYLASVALACVLLIAGLVVYHRAHLPDAFVLRGPWWDYLPMVAMAYGSLLLLSVAIVEIRVRHAHAGSMVLRARTLDELVAHLTMCQERERETLSARLHDDVGGLVAALKLELEDLPGHDPGDEQWERVDALVRKLLNEVRGLSALLYPRLIGTMGLKGALDELGQRFQSGKPRVHMDIPNAFHGLRPERSLCVLRIIQEGIVNAARHADADQVWVRLKRDGNVLKGRVDDDGKGLNQEEEGMGITLMRERARKLGGTLSLGASPRGGAQLRFTLPWSGEDPTVAL